MNVNEILPKLKNPEKQSENVLFKKYLKQFTNTEVDIWVREITNLVEPNIDCTQCGNCCKKLEPGLQFEEIEILAQQKQMDVMEFKKQYVDFDGDALFLKAKPCTFLQNTVCGIYANRPASCADYPHLHQPNFKYKRNVWFNYTICPIVYVVVEKLKVKTAFKAESDF
ncbi:MAG: YkgJ family cysteine cluster protein [Bacteroidia bacterium]